MAAIVLDGKAVAATLEESLRARVSALPVGKVAVGKVEGKTETVPALATILVGDDPASATYVRMKGRACERVGLRSMQIHLPQTTTTEQLLTAIHELNRNPQVRGILLQHPVPHQIDERICFDAIALEKDVDGVTSHGFGRLAMGEEAFGSATPQGIMTLLAHYNIRLSGLHAVVVGRSPILGKPMAAMLLNAHCTVTICHSRSVDLPRLIQQADLVVGAVGKPRFIRGEWIKDGAIVVDAGYHPDQKTGDIELEGVVDRAAAYTPVPGGVGPMTIATLIAQTVTSAERAVTIIQ